MMNDPSVNVYVVIKKADAYFKTHPKGKGSGWKQYQRWKYYSESRYFPTGERCCVAGDLSVKDVLKPCDLSLKSTTTFAGNWKELGPLGPRYSAEDGFSGTGRTEAVWVDPADPNYMYVGSRSGGIFRTTDGGDNWISLTHGLAVIGCNAIDAVATNRNIVYMGSSGGAEYWNPYGLGVLKSTDGGDTWQTTSLNFTVENNFNVRKIKVHPDDSNVIYVASNKGLYKTIDGFATSSKIKSGECMDIELKPDDPNTIYASFSKSIFKSTNGGTSFSKLSGVSGNYLTVSDANSAYLYVSNGTTIYRSTNSGASFTSSTVPFGTWGGFCASNTNADILMNGSHMLHISTNGGESFTEIINTWNAPTFDKYVGNDHRNMINVNGTFYSCNDATLSKTTDNGATWSQLLKGKIGIRDNVTLASSPTEPYNILTGAQDHGTYKYTNGRWEGIFGGDGMMCGFDRDDADTYFVSAQLGWLVRVSNGIKTRIGPKKNNEWFDGAWSTPFVVDPTNSNTIYAAYKDVYKSTDNGNTWTDISVISGLNDNLNIFAVAPSNSNYMYTSCKNRIWRTASGGGSTPWIEITSGLPNLWINSIYVDPVDHLTVYVTMSGYINGSKIFKTTNAGSSWTNVSGGLPNIPALSVVADANSDHGLYLGMDMGVYYKNDNLSDWISFNEEMPQITARAMELVPSINKVRVAAWGRGLWESDTYDARGKAPAAGFTVENQNLVVGSSVQFTDRSSGSPSSWSWTFEGGTPSVSTSKNPLVTYSAVGNYDVTLTVTNENGDQTISKINFIAVTDPSYCDAEGASATWNYIKKVSLSDLENSSAGQNYLYQDFTSRISNVNLGETYTMSISLNGSWDDDITYVWADWNQDLEFDVNEKISLGHPTWNGSAYFISGDVPIPADAKLGNTRMRIRNQTSATDSGSPCGNKFWGEVEDYTLNVLAANPDLDGDGINNELDLCPNTPAGESVDANGCSTGQWDDDSDGVQNSLDLCESTPAGESVNGNGCSDSQLDDDNDAVMNNLDLCPDTPAGELVDANGCSGEQITAVEIIESNESFVYPNPASNQIAIKAMSDGKLVLNIVDIQGIVALRKVYHVSSDSIIEVTLGGIKSGIYIIQIIQGEITRNVRLIISR